MRAATEPSSGPLSAAGTGAGANRFRPPWLTITRATAGAIAAIILVAAGLFGLRDWKPVYAIPVRPLPAYVQPLPRTPTGAPRASLPGPVPSNGLRVRPQPE